MMSYKRAAGLWAVVLWGILGAGPGMAGGEGAAPAPFQLTSGAFADGAEIPLKYTCGGGDVNPPLEIKNVPAKAKSLALTVHDPDAPEGVWVHWVLFNIPPDHTNIPENSSAGEQALTDFGKYAFAGPCPTNDKLHHYMFTAYALDARLNLNEGITMVDLQRAMKGHTLASAVLTGTYAKKDW